MKILARVHFNRHPTQHHVAIYQDGVGIRQTDSIDPQLQQDVWLDFDEIEAIAALAKKHRKTAERLERQDNELMNNID